MSSLLCKPSEALIRRYVNLLVSAWVEVIPSMLVIFILFGSIYQLPWLPESYPFINYSRKFFLIFILGGLLLGIRWRLVKIDLFLICIVLWILSHLLNYLVTHNASGALTIHRFAQSIFVFSLVTFFRQRTEELAVFLSCVKYKAPLIIFSLSIIILSTLFLPEMYTSFRSGFGGNRVNFCIWVAQVIFLLFFSFLIRQKSLKTESAYEYPILILLVSALILCQIVAAGRSGLLMSFVGSIYFIFRTKNHIFTQLLSALFIVIVAVCFSLLLDRSINHFPDYQDPFRAITESGPLPTTEEFANRTIPRTDFVLADLKIFHWLERLSSYRLSIFINTFSNFTSDGLLHGVGVGQFLSSSADGHIYQPHVIYLNHAGEVGILGALACFLLVMYPFTKRGDAKYFPQRAVRFILILWTLVSMLQPEFLISQPGTSMIYWIAYAISLSNSQNISRSKT